MREASIERDTRPGRWILVIRDSIREKTIVRLFDSLAEAQASAAKDADTIRILLS